jgi:hypothetical protein
MQWGSPNLIVFAPQTVTFLKNFQVPNQTTHLHLLPESFPQQKRTAVPFMVKYPKLFTSSFSCSHGLQRKE